MNTHLDKIHNLNKIQRGLYMNFKLNQKLLAIFWIIVMLMGIFTNVFSAASMETSSAPMDKPLAPDTEPPEFGINGTASTATTGDPFMFSINVTDNNITLKKVTVNYTWSGAGQWYNLTLVNTGGSNWTNISIMPTVSTTINYSFWAIDTSNNTNQSAQDSITVWDNDPPTFISGSENITLIIGDGFTIYANFTDNLGINNVDTAVIFYKNETAGTFSFKNMTKTAPGKFEITNITMGINTANDDNDYVYYLWVNDTSDNNATYSAGIFYYTITVTDNINPQVVSGSGDITVYCSTPFNIYANFTDNINVSAAKIFYRTESNPTYLNANMTENITQKWHYYVSNITMNLNVYNRTQNISYYVIGYDNDNNEARYNDSGGTDWNITVIDDVLPVVLTGSGDLNAGTGDYFEIWSNFSDNINVTSAIIYFKNETDNRYCHMEMTPGMNLGTFNTNILNLSQCAGINTINSTTSIVYYIIGIDEFNNSANYTNTSTMPNTDWLITIFDNDAPKILNGSGDFSVTTGDPFTIYVNFSDNIEVSHANIFYRRKVTGAQWLSTSMNESVDKKGNFYINHKKLGLDTYNDDTDIFYYVEAYDSVGLMKVYEKPFSLGYKITIVDNDSPMLVSGNENISIGTGDSFEIYANFTDNIEVKFIRFLYSNQFWDHWEYNEFSVEDVNDDGIWEFKISSEDLDVNLNTLTNDSDYFYYIEVFDGKTPTPNKYEYNYGTTGFRIKVTDDDPPKSASPAGSGDFTATTGEMFTIRANFVDNIKVGYAQVFIRMKAIDTNFPDGVDMKVSKSEPGKFSISNIDLGINTTVNDSDYEYYVVCYDINGNDFTYNANNEPSVPFIIQIVDNDKPTAITGDNIEVEEGTTVEFNGEQSYDNIGISSYAWSFNYNNMETILEGDITSFEFLIISNYKITLTVKDGEGNEGIDTFWVNVTVKNYPPEIISFKPDENKKVHIFEDFDIYVRFSEDMDIDDNNVDFFIMNDSSGNSVNGSYEWFKDDVMEIYQLTFIPGMELKYDKTYIITVTTGVREKFKAGLFLKSGKTWSFSTNPEDSDNDLMPDWWEVKYFNNINEVGPDADDDKDGFTNLEEYEAGTNPRDPKSHPPEEEPDKPQTFNIIAISIAIILIVLILLILFMALMMRKKKKAEEEESKKPKPIEHEILFDEGSKLPTGLKTQPEVGPLPEEPGEGDEVLGVMGEVQLESALQTEPITTKPKTEIDTEKVVLEEEEIESEVDEEKIDDSELDLEDIDLESEPDEIQEGEPPKEADITGFEKPQEELLQEYDKKAKKFYIEGKYSDAILEWQKALEIDPDQPEIQNAIQEALKEIKK